MTAAAAAAATSQDGSIFRMQGAEGCTPFIPLGANIVAGLLLF